MNGLTIQVAAAPYIYRHAGHPSSMPVSLLPMTNDVDDDNPSFTNIQKEVR